MLNSKTILLTVCLLLSLTRAEYPIEDGNLLLNKDLFKNALKEFNHLLVNFHALWCSYSRLLKPHWLKLTENVPKSHKDVKFAYVEAYDEKELAKEYNIEGFPTIIFFINGEPHRYTGFRLESHISEFVDRQLQAPLTTAENAKWVTDKLKEYEWVGLYRGTNDAAVKQIAAKVQDVLFASANDQSLIDTYKIQEGGFVLVNNITKSFSTFSGEVSVENLEKFISESKFDDIPRISKGTAEKILYSDEPSFILFKKKGESGDAAETHFREAAKELKGKIQFAIALYEEDMGKELGRNFGVRDNEWPDVRIVVPKNDKILKYETSEPLTKPNLVAFYESFIKGTAERHYNSEPIPTPEENKHLVYKVVLDSFEDVVIKSEKDVLLMFTAPWCGHCKAMVIVYENMARKTKPVEDFLVAQIDASVNEVEALGLDITYYPTILLFRKVDKLNPIQYTGARTEEAIHKFIKEHASVNVEKMKGPNPFDANEL